MILNLDSILKVFEKTLAKLDKYIEQCDQQTSTSRQTIAQEEQKIETVQVDRQRAENARSRVGEILGK